MGQNELLLEDALNHLLVEPEQSVNWSRLNRTLVAVSEPATCKAAVYAILDRVPPVGIAGFYRNLLACRCRLGTSYLRKACDYVLTTKTPLPRQLAMLSYMWHEALRSGVSREAFRQVCAACAMPELAAQIQSDIAAKAKNWSLRFRRRRGRVALVLTEAGRAMHPPTRVALDHVAALLRANYSVEIFSAFEWQIADLPEWLGISEAWQPLPPPLENLADWRQYLGEVLTQDISISVTLANRQLSPAYRYHAVLTRLAEFAPEWIVLIGLTSGMAQVLYTHYPVVTMSTLSVPPMVPTDVWLSPAYPPRQEVNPWLDTMPIGRIVPRILRLATSNPVISQNRQNIRAALNLPDTAVVVMSAGGRLNNELPRPWLVQWRNFLAQQSDVVWLLVGTEKEIPDLNNLIPTQQLRRLGFVPDLLTLTAQVDIVANPPRLGGGTSVAIAMAAGVPVVSYVDCDGGDKVAHFAVADDESYFACLGYWVQDESARTEAGAAMRALFESRPDEAQMAREFLDAGNLAMELFRKRRPGCVTELPDISNMVCGIK